MKHLGSASGEFSPLRVVPERIAPVSPADARSGYALYRAMDGFEAAIPIAVIERCVAWGRLHDPNEWCGLVVGKLCEHEGRQHVVVLGVVPDAGAIGRPHTVETTFDSEFRTRAAASALFPDAIIIGWVHGHLRHGVRFSSVDRKTQRSWTQPHALGIVVDPWHPDQLSVYRGPDSELLEHHGERPLVPPGAVSSHLESALSPSNAQRRKTRRRARAACLGAALVAAITAVLLMPYRGARKGKDTPGFATVSPTPAAADTDGADRPGTPGLSEFEARLEVLERQHEVVRSCEMVLSEAPVPRNGEFAFGVDTPVVPLPLEDHW